MKKSFDKLNNYCRNCGKKLDNYEQICSKCKTKVINERVKTDNNYIFYIIGSIICFLSFSIFPFCPVLGIIILVDANHKYSNRIVIKFFLVIEIIVTILFIVSFLLPIPIFFDLKEVL